MSMKQAAAVLAALTALPMAYVTMVGDAAASPRRTLTILYTNNNHGYIDPCG